MGVYQKIHQIMKDVEYLNKDTTIKTKRGEYNVISEAAVLKAVRPKLVEQGLIVVPVEIDATRLGTVTTATIKWHIIDVETGDRVETSSVGQGHDDYDKGAGMAQTYALKYLFLKMFQIKTGDDPDLVGNAHHDEKKAEKAQAESLPADMPVEKMKAVCERFNNTAKLEQVIPAEQHAKFAERLQSVYDSDDPEEKKRERFNAAFTMAKNVLIQSGVELPPIEE